MEPDEIVNNLKHLVLGFEPYIRTAGSAEEVEDALHHLEENEEHFHRFEFVKQLKRTIDENLGEFIDEEIEKCNMGVQNGVAGEEPLVSRVTDRVIQSSPMSELMGQLKTSVTSTSDSLLENFQSEFGSSVQQTHENTYLRRMSEDDDTSYISSLNQPGSLMFMNSDRRERLMEDLAKTRPIEIRREALRELNLIPAGEIVYSDQWTLVRKGILDCLSDQDQTLASTGLKFLMQAFSSTSPRTGDIFSLLVEFLILEFSSRKSVAITLKNGLSIRNPEAVRLLKAFRLLNEFQCEAPCYWVRYPERYLKEVMESSLELFSLHPPQGLSPLHVVALLDTKASWFIKWMHGSYSRAPLLAFLHRYKPIVENAVRHCLQYCSSRIDNDSFRVGHVKQTTDGASRDYSGSQVEYAYFVHSVHLLASLICYSQGRNIFPLNLHEYENPVGISELLSMLISVITDGTEGSFKSTGDTDRWHPAHIVTDILKKLCDDDSLYGSCLCNDQITSALIQPLHQALRSQDNLSSEPAPSDSTLLRVADILSVIASSTKGRRHLLYGETGNIFSKTKSSPASIIADFTKQSMERHLELNFHDTISTSVTGEFLYICRLLYSTCEGLQALTTFKLHSAVARTLEKACEESDKAATPTPRRSEDWGSSSGLQLLHTQSELIWEETLQDNLLSFANTPRGILLLQQTEAFSECVAYLAERFAKKVQVGKCETFGYGYMLTQVAATVPGILALQKSGFVEMILDELWSVLECGTPDVPVVTPRAWPVDPIDRPVHKSFLRVLNMVSSFPALYEVLVDQVVPPQETYSLRQGPITIPCLIDRLVLLNTQSKVHSLFNYEQSHTCGIRILSVMISCLDTQLLLQSQYHFQDVLLNCQGENSHQNRNGIVIDMLSLERNYVLVKSYLVGGATERLLPPRLLQQNKEDVFPYPLFSTYPVPREYTPNLSGRSAMKQDNDLSKLLAESKKKPEKNTGVWLEKCRTVFYQVLSTKPELCKGNAVQYLLEQSVTAIGNTQEAIFPPFDVSGNEKSVRSYKLSPLQQLGVTMAVRYGTHLKLLSSNSEATSSLTQLLKLTGTHLQQQQKNTGTPFRFLSGSYPGFDWFTATIFLIFNGSLDRSWKFLQKFSTLAASGYMWSPRLHSSVHLSPKLMCNIIPPVFCRTGHNIELVLQTEFPLIAAAFKMSGYTATQICSHWLRQCFWNYLDWLDICHYISVVTLVGVDYQVYVCVAILRHLQTDIRRHMQHQNLLIFLKEEPIRGFHLGHHLPFMKSLEEKFRKMILRDMLNFSKP